MLGSDVCNNRGVKNSLRTVQCVHRNAEVLSIDKSTDTVNSAFTAPEITFGLIRGSVNINFKCQSPTYIILYLFMSILNNTLLKHIIE